MKTFAGEWIATAVVLIAMSGIVVPAAPAVIEKYNTTPVRDTAAKLSSDLIINPYIGGSTYFLRAGSSVVDVQPHFNAQRGWVPYNGTAGDVIQTGGLTVKVETSLSCIWCYLNI